MFDSGVCTWCIGVYSAENTTAVLISRGGNKLSEALARLANAPGVSIRQLAKALASYKKKLKKKNVEKKLKKEKMEKTTK